MPLAALVFIDSCNRMRVPVSMAALMLKNSRCISLIHNGFSVRWFIFKGGYSALEIAHPNGTLEHWFFNPYGSLAK